MKVRYEFVTEIVEIDVDEATGNVLCELDRELYNSDQRETRRHVSYSHVNDKMAELAAPQDLEKDVIQDIQNEALYKAIDTLLPQQQELIKKVYFQGQTLTRIARDEGVNKSSVYKRLARIHEKLKKVLV